MTGPTGADRVGVVESCFTSPQHHKVTNPNVTNFLSPYIHMGFVWRGVEDGFRDIYSIVGTKG
jgi:hypothetical protein